MDIPPNQTLYVNNLNDKVPKQELRRSLFHLFSQYGSLLDVVALKTTRMRGQAWIVFEDIVNATNALRQLKGFPFYDKPMRIAFAKTTSDAVAKLKKKYVPRAKRKRPADGVKTLKGPTAKPSNEPQKPRAEGEAAPNHTLICTELPKGITAEMLKKLFVQYRDFMEVRLISGRSLAFVQYKDQPSAEVAMTALQDFQLSPTHKLHINYSK